MSAVDTVAEQLVGLLRARRQSLALVESCTGGAASAALTAVPGASECFWGGAVVYGAAAKTLLTGVPAATVARDGAVSERLTLAMARSMRERAQVDYCGAVTGWAGPSADGPDPVGTVYLAVAGPHRCNGCRRQFQGPRAVVRRAAAGELLSVVLAAVLESESAVAGAPA